MIIYSTKRSSEPNEPKVAEPTAPLSQITTTQNPSNNRNKGDANIFKVGNAFVAIEYVLQKQHVQNLEKYRRLLSLHQQLLEETPPDRNDLNKVQAALTEAIQIWKLSAELLGVSKSDAFVRAKTQDIDLTKVPDFDAPMLRSRDAARYLGENKASIVGIARKFNIRMLSFTGLRSCYFYKEDLDRHLALRAANAGSGRSK